MSQIFKTLIPLAIVFSVLVATNFIYAAWLAPAGAPSAASNSKPPINESSTNQIKLGDITALNLKAGGQVWAPAYCDEFGGSCAPLSSSSTRTQSGTLTSSVGSIQNIHVTFATAYTIPPIVMLSVTGYRYSDACTHVGSNFSVNASNITAMGFDATLSGSGTCGGSQGVTSVDWVAMEGVSQGMSLATSYVWTIGGWSACQTVGLLDTNTCLWQGTQTRTGYYCLETISGSVVADSYCGTKPIAATSQSCTVTDQGCMNSTHGL